MILKEISKLANFIKMQSIDCSTPGSAYVCVEESAKIYGVLGHKQKEARDGRDVQPHR